jgi:hypothetical protein
LTATGSSLLWYNSAAGGNGSQTAPTPSTASADTTNYYVSQTINGCESNKRGQIEVIVVSKPAQPTITQSGDSLISSSKNDYQYQWYNSQNGIISGATTQFYKPGESGYYYVMVTLKDCAAVPSAIFNFILTGINETAIRNGESGINIYPNPAKNELNILVTHSDNIKHFEILNSIGNIVYKSNITDKIVVNLSELAGGIYMVRLFSDQSTYNRMFVKQ